MRYLAISVLGLSTVISLLFLSSGVYLKGKPETVSLYTSESGDEGFTTYMAIHGKSYSSVIEYEARKSIYIRNLEMIARSNALHGDEYRLEPNRFSDLSEEEIFGSALGGVPPKDEGRLVKASVSELVGGPVNWAGYMNPVRDQGNCGSCWAFATIGTVEGRWSIRRGG